MSTAAIRMKNYETEGGEETRRGGLMGYATGMIRACPLHAGREREKRMREWHQMLLHEGELED